MLEHRYDLERATRVAARVAARVGRALAVTLVAVGVWVNFWFLFIGVFVYFGASAEEAATIVHVRLRGSRIADVMLLDPVVVDHETSVADLRSLLRRSAQRAFPIVGTQGYEGMIDAASVEHSPPGYLAAPRSRHAAAA